MDQHATLSGRVTEAPSAVLDREILKPQSEYELQHLLPFYLAIENVSLDASIALGIIAPHEASAIRAVLDRIAATAVEACRASGTARMVARRAAVVV